MKDENSKNAAKLQNYAPNVDLVMIYHSSMDNTHKNKSPPQHIEAHVIPHGSYGLETLELSPLKTNMTIKKQPFEDVHPRSLT